MIIKMDFWCPDCGSSVSDVTHYCEKCEETKEPPKKGS